MRLKIRYRKHRNKAVPSRKIWRRPLMVRQPYSVAVLSTGGRFPSSSLREKTEMRGGAFFNGKEGRDDFRKLSFWLKGDGGIRKSPSLTVRKDG